MAFQIVSGYLFPHFGDALIAPALGGYLLDAIDEKFAAVFEAPKTGTIDAIVWATRTVTTGATMDVRLEGVSAVNGDPTGSLLAANTNGAQVVADADDNTQFVTALTASVAVTRGNLIACVVVAPAGANLNIAASAVRTDNGFPYGDHWTASAWAKKSDMPCMGVRYNDGSYAWTPWLFPASTFGNTAFNSASTPDERGLYFSSPVPVRASGIWVYVDADADFDLKLYDSDGSTVLKTIAVDTDLRALVAARIQYHYFPASQELLANTNYRLTALPGASSIGLAEFTVNAAAIMDAFSGGQACHLTTRADAGAWTQTTTQRPIMGLIIDGLSDGAGGGGMIVHPGMSGGMRG